METNQRATGTVATSAGEEWPSLRKSKWAAPLLSLGTTALVASGLQSKVSGHLPLHEHQPLPNNTDRAVDKGRLTTAARQREVS